MIRSINQRIRGHLPGLAIYLLAVTLIVVVLFPLAWSIGSSFKGMEEQVLAPNSLLPHQPTLVNYAFLFAQVPNFIWQLFNSLLVAASAVFLHALLAVMAGYGFARIEFWGREPIFYVIIVSMFIPRAGGLMAQYELLHFLHLRNLPGLILTFASALPISMFIMRQTFLVVPKELEEAAQLDGANLWQVFRQIALPLGASGLIVVCILKFVDVWGDYLFTLTIIDDPQQLTAAVGVAIVRSFINIEAVGVGAGATVRMAPGGVLAAANVITMLPVVLLYIVMQKWFVRGLTEGALKL